MVLNIREIWEVPWATHAMFVLTLSADERAFYMKARRSPLKLPKVKPYDIGAQWEKAAARAEDIVLH